MLGPCTGYLPGYKPSSDPQISTATLTPNSKRTSNSWLRILSAQARRRSKRNVWPGSSWAESASYTKPIAKPERSRSSIPCARIYATRSGHCAKMRVSLRPNVHEA